MEWEVEPTDDSQMAARASLTSLITLLAMTRVSFSSSYGSIYHPLAGAKRPQPTVWYTTSRKQMPSTV